MDKRARGTNEDPLSAASAGLLALGLPLHSRSEALALLAHMLDLADTSGEVDLDDKLMALEARLGVSQCLDGYTWLQTLGVIRRTKSGWVIPFFAEHNGPVGATAASMLVLRRHMEGAQTPALGLVPDLAPEAPLALPNRKVVPMRRWRRTVPIAAAVAAASAAALTGVTQLLPQAASNSRNTAVSAAAPSTNATTGAAEDAVTSVTDAVTGLTSPRRDGIVGADARRATDDRPAYLRRVRVASPPRRGHQHQDRAAATHL